MATQTTKTALDRIKDKRTKNLDITVEDETFIKKKKHTDWIWYYFPIPKRVIVKGLSDEKRTVPYALTDADTMAFIANENLYKKYWEMVKAVDYATFFEESNKEDDKRKFKESIFHFLHFSIDFLTFHNTREQYNLDLTDDKLLAILNSDGFNTNIITHDENLYKKAKKLLDHSQYDARVFVKNKHIINRAKKLIEICFDKKNNIEANDTNLEYINEQWWDLQRQIMRKIGGSYSFIDQLTKLKKKHDATTEDGSCFFWAILQTISKNKDIAKDIQKVKYKDIVENLRRNVIKAMIGNQDVLFGKNVDPEHSGGNIKNVEGEAPITSFSSQGGRVENDNTWNENTIADVAVNNSMVKEGKSKTWEQYITNTDLPENEQFNGLVEMTWDQYTKHMSTVGNWADNGVVAGMSFYLKRKIYIISKNSYTENAIFDPINYINGKTKKRLIKENKDVELLDDYDWPKNKPIIITYTGVHYEQTQDHKYDIVKDDVMNGDAFLKKINPQKNEEEETEEEKTKGKPKGKPKGNTITPNLGEPLITSNKCYVLKDHPNGGWCAKYIGPCNGGKRGGGKSKKRKKISRRKMKRKRKQSKRRKKKTKKTL